MTIPTPPGKAFDLDTRLWSSFKLGTFDLMRPWCEVNCLPLLGSPAVRGEDTLVPEVSGVDPNPRRPTGTQLELTVNVTGYADDSGSITTDPFAQFVTNWYVLRTHCDPISTGDGTIAGDLLLAGTVHKTGSVTPEGIVISSMDGAIAVAKFTLSLPDGALGL